MERGQAVASAAWVHDPVGLPLLPSIPAVGQFISYAPRVQCSNEAAVLFLRHDEAVQPYSEQLVSRFGKAKAMLIID